MAHDTDKTQQNKRLAQQGKAFSECRRFPFRLLFVYLRCSQQKDCNNCNNHINREKYPPAQAERRNHSRCAPHRDIRSQERSDSVYKLSESQTTGQLIPTDDIREQRIQRSLHQGITDTQQRKGNKHQHITIAKDWEQQREECNDQTK